MIVVVVDDQCIDCKVCTDIAPDIFTRCEDSGLCYVARQPESDDEEEECEEAIELCPTMAIAIQD